MVQYREKKGAKGEDCCILQSPSENKLFSVKKKSKQMTLIFNNITLVDEFRFIIFYLIKKKFSILSRSVESAIETFNIDTWALIK